MSSCSSLLITVGYWYLVISLPMSFFTSPEIRFITKNIIKKKWLVSSLFLFDIFDAGITLLIPYLAKIQIEYLEGKHINMFSALTTDPVFIFFAITAFIFFAHVTDYLFQSVRSYIWNKADFALTWDIEQEICQRLANFDHAFLKNGRNQRIIHSLFNVIRIVKDILGFISGSVRDMIIVVGIIPIFFSLNPWLSLIVVGTVLLQSSISHIQMKRDHRVQLKNERLEDQFWRLRYLLRSRLVDIMTISGEDIFLKKYQNLRDDMFQFSQKEWKVREAFSITKSSISSFSEGLCGLVVGMDVLMKKSSIGTLSMSLLYASQLKSSLRSLFRISEEAHRIHLTLKRLGFFLSLQPRFDMSHVEELPCPTQGDLIVDHLSFTYPDLKEEERAYIMAILKANDTKKQKGYDRPWESKEYDEWRHLLPDTQDKAKEILHGTSLTARWGEITALVGKNGSGKTTLTNLLMRSMDPTNGTIAWDGRFLTTIDPKIMRNSVSIIQQTPFLLENWSLRDNLTIGSHLSYTDQELIAMLDRVGVLESIDQKNLLDLTVGDDIQLSGGQTQLIAIARVLLQNKPILIFDEGTNQLDAEKEAVIMDILKEMKKDHLIIMITHRMTSARRADQIYVLDGGHIVESGKHDQLLENKTGLYTSFWNKQVVE